MVNNDFKCIRISPFLHAKIKKALIDTKHKNASDLLEEKLKDVL